MKDQLVSQGEIRTDLIVARKRVALEKSKLHRYRVRLVLSTFGAPFVAVAKVLRYAALRLWLDRENLLSTVGFCVFGTTLYGSICFVAIATQSFGWVFTWVALTVLVPYIYLYTRDWIQRSLQIIRENWTPKGTRLAQVIEAEIEKENW